MLRINQRPMRFSATRLESDRDTLPFPDGGVRGHTESNDDVVTTTDLAHNTFAHLDRLQHRLDQLSADLEEDAQADLRTISGVIGRISASTGSWPPPAAA